MTDSSNSSRSENTEDRQSAPVWKFTWKQVVAIASIIVMVVPVATLLFQGAVGINALVQDIKRTQSLENQIESHHRTTYGHLLCLKTLMENYSDNSTGNCLISNTFSVMDVITIKTIYGSASTSVTNSSVGQP